MNELIIKGKAAKEASKVLRTASQVKKNEALKLIAETIKANKDYIIAENKKDLEKAKENGVKDTMLDRLKLTEQRINDMVEGAYKVAGLDDPVGEVISMWQRPNGLRIGKKRVPLGIIGIIYEARPNVTVDAALLCLKTSNVAILKGGKEALYSNIALVKLMREALKKAGLPLDTVNIIEDVRRETTVEFMKLNEYLDVLIPRGGAGLIKAVVENATVPVIETGTGNCHIYVDSEYDMKMAKEIIINAKVQRPSVCNACESLVIHKDVADDFLPYIYNALCEHNVEVRGCEKSCKIVKEMKKASDADFYTEYNDFIISVKVVDCIDDAIEHINSHSTGHSEAIVTTNYFNSERFLNEIDSACVYVNASTRFTDGFEFGFGAEIGISTQRLHARGPMGLNELTTEKYVIYGEGQVRK